MTWITCLAFSTICSGVMTADDGGLPMWGTAGLRSTGRLALKLLEGNVVDLGVVHNVLGVDDDMAALIARGSNIYKMSFVTLIWHWMHITYSYKSYERYNSSFNCHETKKCYNTVQYNDTSWYLNWSRFDLHYLIVVEYMSLYLNIC